MINEIGKTEMYAWGLCFVLQLALLGLLVLRRNYLKYPAFTVYLAGSVAQNVAQFIIYTFWGFRSHVALESAWIMRTAMVLLRAGAVLELCHQVFARYRGIWAFIWKTLVIGVALVAVLAMALSNSALEYRILNADRAANLAVAFAIVALLVFARHYQVEGDEPTRTLAVGFFLYSCSLVISDVLLEASPKTFYSIWNFLGTVCFISSVLVWGWALRQTVAQPSASPEMLPAAVYRALSPEVNRRLNALNDRLSNVSKGLSKKQEQGS